MSTEVAKRKTIHSACHAMRLSTGETVEMETALGEITLSIFPPGKPHTSIKLLSTDARALGVMCQRASADTPV